MIVMKFGGSSLASPDAVRRVAAIVNSQRHREITVVVSALGDTTDRLLDILDSAARGESYFGWKRQEELRTYHFCLTEDLLDRDRLTPIDAYLRQTFRDLHVRMLEVAEGERPVTPELRDWVTSTGEQLSSRIVTAAFEQSGTAASHLDSTKLILTDDQFTNAEPRYWETYARIRWAVAAQPRGNVLVLGGFIGAAEDGRITTLGRGGSDLTASIVGAALNADEIQVWKDVDGMLTWDPRVKTGGHRLKSLSYDEAAELAHAGAAILHPETIRPAQRLRIPVIIRNTFRPEGEGTRIGPPNSACLNPVKSIVSKSNLTILELRSPAPEESLPADSATFIREISKQHKAAKMVALSDKAIFLSLDGDSIIPDLGIADGPCLQARVRTYQALLTFIGHNLKRCDVALALARIPVKRPIVLLPQNGNSCSVSIAVAQEDLAVWIEILQKAFFSDVDPAFFAPSEPTNTDRQVENEALTAPTPASIRQPNGFRLDGERLAARSV